MRYQCAIKALTVQLALCNGGVTAVVYACSGLVLWPQTLMMVAGTVLGVGLAADWATGSTGPHLHQCMVAAGLIISLYLFVHVYTTPA